MHEISKKLNMLPENPQRSPNQNKPHIRAGLGCQNCSLSLSVRRRPPSPSSLSPLFGSDIFVQSNFLIVHVQFGSSAAAKIFIQSPALCPLARPPRLLALRRVLRSCGIAVVVKPIGLCRANAQFAKPTSPSRCSALCVIVCVCAFAATIPQQQQQQL